MSAPTQSGCYSKLSGPWRALLAHLRHPIHPLEPIAPDNSEFILIEPRVHIRVIHVAPDTAPLKPHHHHHHLADKELHPNSKRSSLSEEYWFTKWNKPLKIGNCNCSFRRSLRFSLLADPAITQKIDDKRISVSSFDVAPKRIVNVETFVERIIQETFFEAFQEYYMVQTKKRNGTINFAYDWGDEEVMLRPKNVFPNCVTAQPQKALPDKDHYLKVQRNSLNASRTLQCVHKRNVVQTKPLIMLFHGIGTSADLWWLVMNSLINKGYEVIAPDLLGHGYSSAPDKVAFYTFHNLLLHAITIFDHYSPDDKRKCILIGHSYGCSLVTALYRHRASQITQLVLISGGGPTPLASPVKNNEISPFGCVHTLFKPLIFCGLKRSFLFSSRGKHFDACEEESAIPSQILRYLSEGQNWPEGDAAFHRRILVPTLLVHGLQDKQVTLVQQCEMERTIPRAFLELIPNAGHMSMLETPEHLSHMIICFIDTWT